MGHCKFTPAYKQNKSNQFKKCKEMPGSKASTSIFKAQQQQQYLVRSSSSSNTSFKLPNNSKAPTWHFQQLHLPHNNNCYFLQHQFSLLVRQQLPLLKIKGFSRCKLMQTEINSLSVSCETLTLGRSILFPILHRNQLLAMQMDLRR